MADDPSDKDLSSSDCDKDETSSIVERSAVSGVGTGNSNIFYYLPKTLAFNEKKGKKK